MAFTVTRSRQFRRTSPAVETYFVASGGSFAMAALGDPLTDTLAALRLIAATALIFFIPGYGWIKATWPGPKDLAEEYNSLYVATLSMVLSVATVIFVGFVLASIPPPAPEARGYFTLEVLLPVMLALTAVAWAAAWWRGGLPWLGRISQRLVRSPAKDKAALGAASDRELDDLLHTLRELSSRREQLRAQTKRLEQRAQSELPQQKVLLLARAEVARRKLRSVEREIERMEHRRSDQIAAGQG